MKYTKEDITWARERLAKHLHDGATVWTVLEHVSASGMSRNIRVMVLEENEPWYLTNAAAIALGWPMRKDAIRVQGCGMDMGHHLVDVLGRTLGVKLRHRWL